MKNYRNASFVLMLLFAITGILFLGLPDKVLAFFNALSPTFAMPQSPLVGWNFFVILTAGYMYLVTVLAFLMFKHPENRYFPLLLMQAKLVSSFLSLALFVAQAHYLIYLVNFLIDGVIGAGVLALYLKMRRTEWAYS